MTYSLFCLFSNSLDGFVTLNHARFETKDMLNTCMEFLNDISSNKLSEKWKNDDKNISYLWTSSKQRKNIDVIDFNTLLPQIAQNQIKRAIYFW